MQKYLNNFSAGICNHTVQRGRLYLIIVLLKSFVLKFVVYSLLQFFSNKPPCYIDVFPLMSQKVVSLNV